MLFTKDTPLTKDNVFATCPRCGKPVHVDIYKLIRSDPREIMGINFYCDDCKMKLVDIRVKNSHHEIYVFDDGDIVEGDDQDA